MMHTHTAAQKARGSAAIEFCLIFIILLMLLYGVVGFFGPLLLASSYQQVASEALREAVTARYQPGTPPDPQARVRQVIQRSWLPSAWVHTCSGYPADQFLAEADGQWQVCLRHPAPHNLILPLPFVRLPTELRGEASLCLNDCDSPGA